MTTRTRHYVATAAAILCFVGGILLSRRIEPGVSVTTVTLAGDTPALRFLPVGPGPHPIALLAHGFSGSKENLFVYGEALAKAGFDCYAVDLPGHGASPRLFSANETISTLGEVARAIGPVDVYIGHSMGGSTGGEAVFEGRIQPKLFVAIGSMPLLGEHGPPLLLLAGRFDPYYPPAVLQTRTNAQLVISPWSEHGLEIIDPILVNAAVKAACAAVGKTPPEPALAWLWRIFGGALAVGGALGLVLCLPKLPAPTAWLRGILVAAFSMIALLLANSMGIDKALHWPHVPYQVAGIIVTFLLLLGAGRLRLPRWGFLALTLALWLGCVLSLHFLNLHLSVFRLVLSLMFLPILCTGTLLAWIADRKGTRRDGDVAMAIFVGFILFQWGEPPRKAAFEPVPSRVAIKLDAKRYDSISGHYEFPPNNAFPTGLKLTIWKEGDHLAGQWSGFRAYTGIVEIYPESETNLFLAINGKQNGEQLTFIENEGEATEVIDNEPGNPVLNGRKVLGLTK